MPNFLNKIQTSQNNQMIIVEIKNALTQQVNAGMITTEQLNKIKSLAADADRLKKALRWL